MPMHTYDAANFAIDNEYNKFQIWGVRMCFFINFTIYILAAKFVSYIGRWMQKIVFHLN